jgi:hypothetical protein
MSGKISENMGGFYFVIFMTFLKKNIIVISQKPNAVNDDDDDDDVGVTNRTHTVHFSIAQISNSIDQSLLSLSM